MSGARSTGGSPGRRSAPVGERRRVNRQSHAHGIWHLFVLAGSAAHFIAILIYVV